MPLAAQTSASGDVAQADGNVVRRASGTVVAYPAIVSSIVTSTETSESGITARIVTRGTRVASAQTAAIRLKRAATWEIPVVVIVLDRAVLQIAVLGIAAHQVILAVRRLGHAALLVAMTIVVLTFLTQTEIAGEPATGKDCRMPADWIIASVATTAELKEWNLF